MQNKIIDFGGPNRHVPTFLQFRCYVFDCILDAIWDDLGIILIPGSLKFWLPPKGSMAISKGGVLETLSFLVEAYSGGHFGDILVPGFPKITNSILFMLFSRLILRVILVPDFPK